MLEFYIDSEAKLRQLRQCPVGKYLDDFAQWLQSSGYKQRPAQLILRAAAHFGHWVSEYAVPIEQLCDELINSFARHLPTCACSHGFQGHDKYHAAGARRFLAHLRTVGTVPLPAVEPVPMAPLAKQFRNWMRQHRGVTEGTLASYLPLVQEFLAKLGDDTNAYDASQVRGFILAVSSRHGEARTDGIFDQANATQEVQWGTARIEFTDCSNGNFEYDSPLQNISGGFGLQRLTPDVSCADNHEQAHVSFVTSSNSWLDAQGSWIFDVCVDLGPAESHGKEVFRFDGASLSFDIDHYNAAGCQGPVDVQHFAFELTRVDKVMSSLEGVPVITNRVLLKDMVSGDVTKQTLYFDVSGSPTIMTHGNFDGGLDADGFPATLHEVFASPLP